MAHLPSTWATNDGGNGGVGHIRGAADSSSNINSHDIHPALSPPMSLAGQHRLLGKPTGCLDFDVECKRP